MADTYTTNIYLDVLPPVEERVKGRRGGVNTLYRAKSIARACSGFGLQGFAKNPEPHFGRKQQTNVPKPTVPQFSGTVVPGAAREVSLCLYPSNTVSPVVLETMPVDASGNFACEGWYRPEPNGQYFFRIAGDDTYSTKDFPVQQPVENEYRKEYGQFPADTAINPQVLYVEDSFTDIEGTVLSAHTPVVDVVGSGWVLENAGQVQCGNHADQSRFVAYSNSGTTQVAHIETNDVDALINLQFTVGDGTLRDEQHGMVVRYADSNNYIRVVIEDSSTDRPTLSVISKVAGVDTVLWSNTLTTGAGPLTLDRYYQLNVLVVDNRVIVDLYLYTYTTNIAYWKRCIKMDLQGVTDHASASKYGMYLGNIGMYVDELKIWSV